MKRIVALRTLREFWETHPETEQHLKTWYQMVKNSDWKSPNEIKSVYRNASILKDNRVVFNIKGNEYRLIVRFNYDKSWAFIQFIGTHKEYDTIDAEEITYTQYSRNKR